MAKWSARRINRIIRILDAKRYLEIGVEKGSTLTSVRCEQKIGVEPNSAVIRQENIDPNTHVFSGTSDDFFAQYVGGVFDVVFIDGLHTAEQAFRDFCSTLPHSHARTIWIIDDVHPTSALSAEPDLKRLRHLRRRLHSTETSYHGDVYRAIVAIDAFLPCLQIRTIMTGGNAQAVIWMPRTKRPRAHPYFDFKEIAHFTFFDLIENPEVLHPAREADVMADLALEFGDAGQKRLPVPTVEYRSRVQMASETGLVRIPEGVSEQS